MSGCPEWNNKHVRKQQTLRPVLVPKLGTAICPDIFDGSLSETSCITVWLCFDSSPAYVLHNFTMTKPRRHIYGPWIIMTLRKLLRILRNSPKCKKNCCEVGITGSPGLCECFPCVFAFGVVVHPESQWLSSLLENKTWHRGRNFTKTRFTRAEKSEIRQDRRKKREVYGSVSSIEVHVGWICSRESS